MTKTPKEYAEYLVQRMQAQRYMALGTSVQCAVICVTEMIEENTTLLYYHQRVGAERKEYLLQVIQELNGL